MDKRLDNVKMYYWRCGEEIARGITEDMDMSIETMAYELCMEKRQLQQRITGHTKWKPLEVKYLTEEEGMDPSLFWYIPDDKKDGGKLDEKGKKMLDMIQKKGDR